MKMYDLIMKKRDGGELTDKEITFIVNSICDDTIPDYQISAFLMAVFFQNLSERETLVLTKAMAQSGDMVDLSQFGDKTADKHSTGGVGDKTTLIAAPIAAACGVIIAKMSGRGLGHTGGTVDKLESIPGFKTELSSDEFIGNVQKIGISVIGQSLSIAPADKKLYALRDVTATVENQALIASSIMSKKLACGAKNIVLDVKWGNGAFMKNLEDATSLAKIMVKIGKGAKRNICAIISDMNAPLGTAVGNALEVKEAIETLKGHGDKELCDICLEIAGKMIEMSLKIDSTTAKSMARTALDDGTALEKLRQMIIAQGGDAGVIDDASKLPCAKYHFDVKSQSSGFIWKNSAIDIGNASLLLGAGRRKKDDKIDFGAGIIVRKKLGEDVKIGDTLATLYSNTDDFSGASLIAQNSFIIKKDEPVLEAAGYSIIE